MTTPAYQVTHQVPPLRGTAQVRDPVYLGEGYRRRQQVWTA